jgi:streptogramin lyase
VIELDLPAVAKTRAEIEEEREYYAALFTVMEMGDPQYNVYCDPFPFRHPVRSMTVDDARRLWVLRGDTDEVSFFLFSPSGELLREFTLPGLPPSEQLVFRVRGHRMLVYAENPADYQRIWLVEIPLE